MEDQDSAESLNNDAHLRQREGNCDAKKRGGNLGQQNRRSPHHAGDELAKSEQAPAIVFLAQLRRERGDRCDEADKEVTGRLGKDHGASIQPEALNNQEVGDKAGG